MSCLIGILDDGGLVGAGGFCFKNERGALLPFFSFFLSFFLPTFYFFFCCLSQILFCLKLTSVTYDKIARRTLLIILSLLSPLFCACFLFLCMFYGLSSLSIYHSFV